MRFVILALGMALTSGAGAQEVTQPTLESQPIPTVRQEQSGSAGEQNTGEEPSYADRLLTAIERIEPAVRDLIAEEDEIERQAERSRDDADLQAQKEMARWAFWMTLATGASVFLTAVGLALIGQTLLYTKQAAIHAGEAVTEAKNATKAAQDAVTVSQDLGEAQVRAYLHCRAANYRLDKDGIVATVEVANTGQSPASNIVLQGTVTFHDVVGRREHTRVTGHISSETVWTNFEPIVAGGIAKEAINFFFEFHFPMEEYHSEAYREAMLKESNETWFDLTLKWKDVFGKLNELPLTLTAIIGPHPHRPSKARSRGGKLDLRMEDMRHRVVEVQAEE